MSVSRETVSISVYPKQGIKIVVYDRLGIKMRGLHIIADYYSTQCKNSILVDKNNLMQICIDECQNGGLTPLGEYFYQFKYEDGKSAGVTGTVVLAESHLAIHTWPEQNNVTLDIYVCNFSADNSEKARSIYKNLEKIFKPKNINYQEIFRGTIVNS